jgi:hypothetical protein
MTEIGTSSEDLGDLMSFSISARTVNSPRELDIILFITIKNNVCHL